MSRKKTVVLGMGRSGVAALKLLTARGTIPVAVNKGCPSKWESPLIRENSEALIDQDEFLKNESLENYGELILSPGIPRTHPLVEAFISHSLSVVSEIELGFRFWKGDILAITGTNGKTTTTSLLGEILKGAGRSVFIGGNIGTPFCEGVLEQLQGSKYDSALLELSSFQLESMTTFHPKVAAILNLSKSHMERYDSIEDYGLAKLHIVDRMNDSDVLFIPKENDFLKRNLKDVKASVVTLPPNDEGLTTLIGEGLVGEFKLPGLHNLKNLAFAVSMARSYGLKDEEMRDGIRSFKGVEHRLERIDSEYEIYNDSKSTNWTSTKTALESFEGNVHLILGGQLREKTITIPDDVRKVVESLVAKLWLFGEAGGLLEKELTGMEVEREDKLELLFPRVLEESKTGVLVFSPGFPSFDQFKNFEERGKCFKNLILSNLGRE